MTENGVSMGDQDYRSPFPALRWKKIVEKNAQYFFALEERVLKLHYMQLITTETDGLRVKTVHSEVRGESMEQCFEYTKKLHNGEVKSKNH
jgi:hypothetical protein